MADFCNKIDVAAKDRKVTNSFVERRMLVEFVSDSRFFENCLAVLSLYSQSVLRIEREKRASSAVRMYRRKQTGGLKQNTCSVSRCAEREAAGTERSLGREDGKGGIKGGKIERVASRIPSLFIQKN